MSGVDLERLNRTEKRHGHPGHAPDGEMHRGRVRRRQARQRARKRRRDREACGHRWLVEDLPVTGNKMPGSRVKLTCRRCGLIHHTLRASLARYTDA